MKYQCEDNIEGLYKADTLIRIFRTCHTGNLPFNTSTRWGCGGEAWQKENRVTFFTTVKMFLTPDKAQ
jgi:hypothetical protein